jgi:putative chitinase
MNYLQLMQKRLNLTPDGIIGPKTVNALMLELGLTDKLVVGHVLGQMAHESGGFVHFRENLNYNEAGLLNIFSKYYKGRPGLAKAHARKPETIANYVYANRNGNGDEASGDGWKYRGGFGLQLTGKTNFTEFFEEIGLPLDTDPDTLKDDPKVYFQAGFFWFKKNGVDKKCTSTSRDCIIIVTKRVNGGTNGLDDRIVKTNGIFKALGLA